MTAAGNEEPHVDMDVVVAKVLAIVIITSLTVLAGLLPCRLMRHCRRPMLKRRRMFNDMVSGGKCFSGGVYLGVCFLHLIPETRHKVDAVLEHVGSRSHYPVAELLTMAGFFGVIFGEHVIRCLYYKFQEDSCLPRFDHDSYSFDQDYIPTTEDPAFEGCDLIECRSLHSLSQTSYSKDDIQNQMNSPQTLQDESIITPVPRIHINGLTPINQTITSFNEANLNNVNRSNSLPSEHGAPIPPPIHSAPSSVERHEWYDLEPVPPLPMQDLEVRTVVTELSRQDEQGRGHIRSAFLLAALSFHGVFEGMALGLQAAVSDAWLMCVAVLVHRAILAFGMSLQYAREQEKPSTIVFSISAFSIICVVGIIIGIAISAGAQLYNDVDVPNAILQSLATGTIFCIVFLNILFKELDGNKDVKKISCTFVGFAFMAVLLAVAKS
ncbi:uncharacterized protein LOC128229233 [Mya arenaria]|uniref:uncharacterized protein LOC128229185 n=1 Tax=Mya arenaria TaxID=6604 RepID=UPI0022DFEE67|nr:uncharacterized protein LOC128229185 [Mya arenaria]XP_052796960.1 uncharacterized protein LOC128229233 [Mya arenaria]